MKKTVFLIFLLLPVYVFAQKYPFEGTWATLDNNTFSRTWDFETHEYSWGTGKTTSGMLTIDYQKDMFSDDSTGLEYVFINVSNRSNQPVQITLFCEKERVFSVILLTYLSDDKIQIEEGDPSVFPKGTPIRHIQTKTYIRVSSAAFLPLCDAVLNDTRVRCRTEPNLNCETWGYLNAGDKVLIKDISYDPFEIDGESWYWYLVRSDALPDGWVYGKYLDIEE